VGPAVTLGCDLRWCWGVIPVVLGCDCPFRWCWGVIPVVLGCVLRVCFLSFYVAPNIVKYFRNYFPKCKQTLKKQSFFLKSFSFANILRWRMFYVETNGA
jgi:hypothetical protein